MTVDAHVMALVGERSLADGAGAKRTFTVARTEAVLKLRAALPDAGARWVLWFSRAVRTLPGDWIVRVKGGFSGREERCVVWATPLEAGSMDIVDSWGVELEGVLSEGLRSEAPDDDDAPSARALSQRLGALVNEVLAGGPTQVTLSVGAKVRRWQPAEAGVAHEDPYVASAGDADAREPGGMALEVVWRRSVGEWIARLFGRGETMAAEVRTRMGAHLIGATTPDADGAFQLRRGWRPARMILMDGIGWFVPVDSPGCWLVRDGARVFDLTSTCQALGVTPPTGLVIAPNVRRTSLGDGVQEDPQLHALLAWLDESDEGVALEGMEDGHARVVPSDAERFHTAGDLGPARTVADLEGLMAQTGELRFVWPHQTPRARTRVRGAGGRFAGGGGYDLRALCLTPSEVAALRQRLPHGRLLHQSLVGRTRAGGAAELDNVRRRSLPAIALRQETLTSGGGDALEMRSMVYVLREDATLEGQHVITIYGRELARGSLRGQDGLVVHTALRPAGDGTPSMEALRREEGLLRRLDAQVHTMLRAQAPALMGVVLSQRQPFGIPYLHAMVSAVTVHSLGLRYAPDEDGRAVLRWRDSALLEVPVGTRDGAPVKLHVVLEELARGVEVEPALRRDRARPLAPIWKLLDLGAREGDGWAVSAPREALATCRLDAADLRRDLEASPRDPRARARLRMHLLASRLLGLPEDGLDRTRLFECYDPLAKRPDSLWTLAQVLSTRPAPVWVFPTAATRGVRAKVLPMTPGLAALLSHVTKVPDARVGAPFYPSGVAAGGNVSSALSPPPAGLADGAQLVLGEDTHPHLVERPVHTKLLHGGVWLARPGDARRDEGVAIWHRNLRIQRVHLPGALASVAGSVELRTRTPPTDAGQRALMAALIREGEALIDSLSMQRLLARPGTERHTAVAHAWREVLGHRGPRDSPALALRLSSTAPGFVESLDDLDLRLRAVGAQVDDGLKPGLWLPRLMTAAFEARTKIARFSRKSVEVQRSGGRQARLTLRLGLRHPWNRRVLGRGVARGQSAPGAWEVLVASAAAVVDAARTPAGSGSLGPLGQRRVLHELTRWVSTLRRADR